MTTYERIKLEGIIEGEAKGEAKGKAEGKAETTVYGIVRGYKNGFTIPQLSTIFGISEAEVKAILEKKSLL